MLLIVPALLIALGVVVRVLAGPDVGYEELVVGLGLVIALPLISLLATSSVLGPEIDDGSLVYLLAKPISRHAVAVSKFVVAWAATILFGAVPLLVLGLINDPARPEVSVAWTIAGLWAATGYTALFMAVSSVTRHAVVVGLVFVFFWEGLLGNLLDGVRWVSIGAWARQIASSIEDQIAIDATVGATYAVLAGSAVLVICVWFTGWRLQRFSMRGET
ncbi:MAG: ABC transporter permease subunit [Nocardioides sp.]